mmetsp:Transcript_11227/g.20355  ORF Transcript_11227/g.20355 Transcript_11227/m.20355 type:complete len:90 (-) Transcript_11227:264-533(-)
MAENLRLCSGSIDDGPILLERSQQFDSEWKNDLYVFVPWDWLVRHQSLCVQFSFSSQKDSSAVSVHARQCNVRLTITPSSLLVHSIILI